MKHVFLAALVAVSLAADQSAQTGVPATRTLRGGVEKPAARPSGPIDVPVHEGTSMSVAISPDRATLATDMQGSIWTLPA